MHAEWIRQYADLTPIKVHLTSPDTPDVLSWQCWLCKSDFLDTEFYRLFSTIRNHVAMDIGLIYNAAVPMPEVVWSK